MANMETFSKAIMASQDVRSYLGSTKFKSNDAYAELHDGALVVLGDLDTNAAYGIKDENVYVSTAPAADTDRVVIVDLDEVSQGTIAGNNYKMGIKLVGLRCMPGFAARYRIPQRDDRFWISGDCFASDPVVGQYAIPTAASTKFTPNATDASATKFCVKVELAEDFTVGANVAGAGRTGKKYLCKVL